MGTKFEVWLAHLFKDLSQRHLLNFQNIDYNNWYINSQGDHRQLDLDFQYVENGIIKQGMMEAKYCSNGYVPYKLRNGEMKKTSQRIKGIETLVEEVYERAVFSRSTKVLLITNKQFEKKVKKVASKIGGLYIVERQDLIKYNLARGGSIYLEQEIMRTDISDYRKRVVKKYVV